MTSEEETAHLMRLTAAFGRKRDADVLVYSGDIGRPDDDRLIEMVVERPRRKNVFLVLCTYGGSTTSKLRTMPMLKSTLKPTLPRTSDLVDKQIRRQRATELHKLSKLIQRQSETNTSALDGIRIGDSRPRATDECPRR